MPPAAPDCAGCAARDEEIALLRDQLDVLRAQVKEQQEKIARLERLLSRNSGNSSMPPSSDDQPGKRQPKQRSRRTDGRRKPGKQPGAPGAYLAWNDHPGKTVDHFPEGDCACGADLAGAEDLGVTASHQVTDIPAQEAQTTQHDRHTVRCRCGRLHTAPAPEEAGAPGTVVYGVNIQAWCVFLMVMHHIPVQRCADILESLTGTRPSDGYVHSLLARAARGVAALLRDLEDAAETYPDAIWPGQAASNLRALIHQANLARAQGLDAVPADSIAEELKLFRHGVRVGLSQVRRIPGGREKQPPGRLLLECLRDREHDVLRFLIDLGVPATNNQAERDARPAKTQQKISGRLRSERPPVTGTPCAATCPLQPNTASASSPQSSAPSPETLDAAHPGLRLEPCPPAITQRDQESRRRIGLNAYVLRGLGYLLNRSGIGSCSWRSPVLHGRFAAGRSRLGG